MILSMMILLGVVTLMVLHDKNVATRAELKRLLILVAVGIVALGAVTLFVDDFKWDDYGGGTKVRFAYLFYLHPGLTLLTVAAGGLMAVGWKISQRSFFMRCFIIGVLLLWGMSMVFLFRETDHALLEKAHRTMSEGHRTKLTEYERIKSVVEAIATLEGSRLLIAYPSKFYQLDNTPRYVLKRFRLKSLDPWESSFDLIFMYEYDISRALLASPRRSAAYDLNVCSTSREFLDGRRCRYVPVNIGDDKLRCLLQADVFANAMGVLPYSK